eukprot:3493075-Pyramimonas_sp.AAC.1
MSDSESSSCWSHVSGPADGLPSPTVGSCWSAALSPTRAALGGACAKAGGATSHSGADGGAVA